MSFYWCTTKTPPVILYIWFQNLQCFCLKLTKMAYELSDFLGLSSHFPFILDSFSLGFTRNFLDSSSFDTIVSKCVCFWT